MPKLSKEAWKQHEAADALLRSDAALSDADREFIYRHWTPLAQHNVGKGGIFFTPFDLCRDVASFCSGISGRVLDACAGIGGLANAVRHWDSWSPNITEIVCVELNPEFVELGRRLLPEARWVRGSIFDRRLLDTLGHFTCGFSNPPFGRVATVDREDCTWLRYRGSAQLMVAEILLRRCERGGFMIVPAADTNYPAYYDRRQTPRETSADYVKWHQLYPGAHLTPLSIETSLYEKEWSGACPQVLAVDLCLDCGVSYLDAAADTTGQLQLLAA